MACLLHVQRSGISACQHSCGCALHSLPCSFEIGRSCDSSSRMSWLDSGRPWGLLLCEQAASDNLSSSLSDDSPPAVQPQHRTALRRNVETQRSGLIKTTLCCHDACPQKPFSSIFLFSNSSRGGNEEVQKGRWEQWWALCIESVDLVRMCVLAEAEGLRRESQNL